MANITRYDPFNLGLDDTYKPSGEVRLHVFPRVANNVDIDDFLPHFIDYSVHAR